MYKRVKLPNFAYINVIKRYAATTSEGKVDPFGNDGQPELYRKFRPVYPKSLLYNISTKLDELDIHRNSALDIACGSGQLTIALAQTVSESSKSDINRSQYGLGFNHVYGIDTSRVQLNNAITHNNIEYKYANAEKLDDINDDSIDLVTIGQALHWFNIDNILKESQRILKKPNGLFSVIGYATPIYPQNTAFQNEFKHYYMNILNSHDYGKDICYWDIDRKMLDFAYDNVKFNQYFSDIEKSWFMEQKFLNETELFGYFKTMTGYQNYINKHSNDADFVDPLLKLRDVYQTELTQTKQSSMMVGIPFFALQMVPKNS